MATCFRVVVRAILEITEVYNIEKLPQLDYTVTVENNYPLQEDEDEEKTLDLQQVNAQAMSRKTFIKKCRRVQADDPRRRRAGQLHLRNENGRYAPGGRGLHVR